MPAQRRQIEERILAVLEALWVTNQTRALRATVEGEVERVLFTFRRSIFPVIPLFYRKLESATNLKDWHLPVLTFGSWVGGDRDGNPAVTPQVSLHSVELHRRLILGYYDEALARLESELSHSERLSPVSERIADEIHEQMMYGLFLGSNLRSCIGVTSTSSGSVSKKPGSARSTAFRTRSSSCAVWAPCRGAS